MSQQQIKEIANRCGLKGDEPWMADFVGLVLEAVADRPDSMSDSSGDAAAYDQREQTTYELEREHAISDCAKAVRSMPDEQYPAPIPEQVAQDPILATWPERIWLQWDPDERTEYPGASEDLTWRADNIHASDVEYVRADLATQSAKQADLQEENRQLRQRIEDLTTAANQCINDALSQSAKQGAQPEPNEEIKQLRNRVSQLEAARIGYASEFPLNADGEPDVGNIHANIRALKAQASVEQATGAKEVTQQAAKAETSKITDGDSARSFIAAWHREHFPTDRTFTNYIMGRNRHCALAGDFAWQLAKALESLAPTTSTVSASSSEQPTADKGADHE